MIWKKFLFVCLVLRNRFKSLLSLYLIVWGALLSRAWERTDSGYLISIGALTSVSFYPHVIIILYTKYFFFLFQDDCKSLIAVVVLPCSNYQVLLRSRFIVELLKLHDSLPVQNHGQSMLIPAYKKLEMVI